MRVNAELNPIVDYIFVILKLGGIKSRVTRLYKSSKVNWIIYKLEKISTTNLKKQIIQEILELPKEKELARSEREKEEELIKSKCKNTLDCIIEKYGDKLDWKEVSQNPSFIPELIEKYKDKGLFK